MAFVGLVNSHSWRHDWKEHVFHKAILLPLSKVREGGHGCALVWRYRRGCVRVGEGGEEAIW